MLIWTTQAGAASKRSDGDQTIVSGGDVLRKEERVACQHLALFKAFEGETPQFRQARLFCQ